MTDTVDSDLQYIRSIAELLESSGLSEISVRRSFPDGGALSIKLSSVPVGATAVSVAVPPPAVAAPPPAAPAPAAKEAASAEEVDSAGSAVTSPMIGTVYLAPMPGAERFVRPGDKVVKGQTLLIIEAMKTLNQIPSPADGVVRKVLVEDGEAVEYGTPIVMLD